MYPTSVRVLLLPSVRLSFPIDLVLNHESLVVIFSRSSLLLSLHRFSHHPTEGSPTWCRDRGSTSQAERPLQALSDHNFLTQADPTDGDVLRIAARVLSFVALTLHAWLYRQALSPGFIMLGFIASGSIFNRPTSRTRDSKGLVESRHRLATAVTGRG